MDDWFVIQSDGGLVLFHSFQVSKLRLSRAPVYEPLLEEFMIPSLADFVDGDRDKMSLCTIRAVKRYLSRTELSRGTSAGQSCSGLNALVCLSQWLRERSRCPETPFRFGLD